MTDAGETARRDVSPPPPPPPPVAPAPVPPAPVVIRQRSWTGVIVMGVILLLVLGFGGYGAYRLMTVAQEQRAAAEEEIERLQKDAEEKAAAEAEAKKQAEAAAAAAEPTPAKDTDSDGLTDVEELLYGTEFRDPDTDGDSYLDGNEVFHRYHPLGEAPSTLLDTGAVKVYENADFAFSIYYPSTWSASASNDTSVKFKSSRQASITVSWSLKEESTSLADWLKSNGSSVDIDDMKEILTKEGYYGYTTDDDRTAYLNTGSAVVTLAYDLGGKTQVEYLQTFQMMVNSFALAQ